MDRILKVSGTIVLFGMIYVMDRITGRSYDFTGLYLLPVVGSAYYFGMAAGLGAAALALLSELTAEPSFAGNIGLFHASTHAATYGFAAFVTANLRSQLLTVRALTQRRDYELELARSIQRAINKPYRPPADSPFEIAAVTEPARELGGDLVQVQPTRSGLFMCLADISGKGVSAALFSALLQETLRTALETSSDPAAVVSAINERMYRALPAEMFVTMFACHLSRTSLRYVSAGHEPAFFIPAGHAHAQRLQSAEGMPIAVRETLAIPATVLETGAGDVLLCYSDGVTDSPGFAHDQEGVRRFFEVHRRFSPAEMATGIIGQATGDGQAAVDDISVLVVRMRETQPANYVI